MDDGNFDANFDGKFDGKFDGNLMGHLMMDSKGWPHDSFDCLLVKFDSPVVQFSNCMTNLGILRTNFQPFPAIKMSHKNLSSKCPIKMSQQKF